MDAAESLRAWRGKRSLAEAGGLIGCDASYVRYLEKRQKVPQRRNFLAKLHDVVGIPTEAWPASPNERGPEVDPELLKLPPGASLEPTEPDADDDASNAPTKSTPPPASEADDEDAERVA